MAQPDKFGPGYRLSYTEDGIVTRIVLFGNHDLTRKANRFKRSADFQKEASEHLKGVLSFYWRQQDEDFVYSSRDFDTDLYQVIKEGIALPSDAANSILRQVLQVLVALKNKHNRGHGRLKLHSILLKAPERKSLARAEVLLTDFWEAPANTASTTSQCLFEAEDIRALILIINQLARGTPDLSEKSPEAFILPAETDERACKCFKNWPALWNVLNDALKPDAEHGIKTFEQFAARLGGNNRPPSPEKRDQTISLETDIAEFFVGNTISIRASASSGLPVELEFLSGPGKLINRNLELTDVGTVILRAVQKGDARYKAADVESHVKVEKRAQKITFATISDKRLDESPVLLNASSSSGLPVSFAVVSGPAELSGSTLRLTAEGSVSIRAFQAGDSKTAPAQEVRQSFLVRKLTKTPQTITFSPIAKAVFGCEPIKLSAQASSRLPVSFRVQSGNVQISDDLLLVKGAGEVVVAAVQEGNEQYSRAEASQTFLVQRAPQRIQIVGNPTRLGVGDSFDLQASADSGLPVKFIIAEGKANLQGAKFTATVAGDCKIKAWQEGNQNFATGEAVISLVVGKGNQTIKLENFPGTVRVGEKLALRAIATSSLPVHFTVESGKDLAQVQDGFLIPKKVGNITLKASQSGDENFNPAPDVSKKLEIGKGPQTVHFNKLPETVEFDERFFLLASSTSGLPVRFEVNSTLAQLNGDEVTPRAPGMLEIKAIQDGNEHYLSANAVQRCSILRKKQRIDFDEVPELKLGKTPFPLEAKATSALPVEFRVLSGPARVKDGALVLTGSGNVTVAATQPGNEYFLPAHEVTHSFRVKDPRKLIAALAAFAVLLLVAAGMLVHEMLRDKLEEYHKFIAANDPSGALKALNRVPSDQRDALRKNLMTAPVIIRADSGTTELHQGETTLAKFKTDLLAISSAGEKEKMEKRLAWSVSVTPSSQRGVRVIPNTNSIHATEELTIFVEAGTNAYTNGSLSFEVKLNNALTSSITNLFVQVQPARAKPPTAEVVDNGVQYLHEGDKANINVKFTGERPWKVQWSDGQEKNYDTRTSIYRPQPEVGTHVYKISRLNDSNTNARPQDITGSNMVIVDPKIEINVKGRTNLAYGEKANLTAEVTGGTRPYHFIWYRDRTPIGSDGNEISDEPREGASTRYSVEVTDSLKERAWTKQASININVQTHPAPTAVVSVKLKEIRSGESNEITVDLTGLQPWTLKWSDGTTNEAKTNHYHRWVNPTADTNYVLRSVTDKLDVEAKEIAGKADVTVYPIPTATLVSETPIRINLPDHTNILVKLEGTPNWILKWSDDSEETITKEKVTNGIYSRPVSPSATVTNWIVSVSDAHYAGVTNGLKGSVLIQVYDPQAEIKRRNGELLAWFRYLKIESKIQSPDVRKAKAGSLPAGFDGVMQGVMGKDQISSATKALDELKSEYGDSLDKKLEADFKTLNKEIRGAGNDGTFAL